MILQLQKLRKKAGYKTQGAFAEALGVPERRYQSWEREEAMMSLEQAYNVTELLGCTLERLLREHERERAGYVGIGCAGSRKGHCQPHR